MGNKMSDIQKLQNEVLVLKGRAFDLNEVIAQKEGELSVHRQLLSDLCSVLGIDASQPVTPEAVIGAVSSLIPSVEVEKGAEDEAAFGEEA